MLAPSCSCLLHSTQHTAALLQLEDQVGLIAVELMSCSGALGTDYVCSSITGWTSRSIRITGLAQTHRITQGHVAGGCSS